MAEVDTDSAPIDSSIQPPDQATPSADRKLFGTFGGVFTPTLLTILGVIMFLRAGWVIGNAGILGGTIIMLLAFGITACTALAMSSITTNIRIGAGGAYAIISQSLGLEVGGSVGIPRYLSQALAVTMYIFGFREGWLYIFPGHSALLVDTIVFLSLYSIAYVSADLAIRVQYVIMAIIVGSLISIGLGAWDGSMQYALTDNLWGTYAGAPENDFSGTSFWIVFAVFFPATTGIMAGANMSGDLEKPRRSIPTGTMAAIAVSLVIYLVLAYWLARSATPEELTSNYYVMMEKAYWGPAVLAGLLGATFSSALASMVGAGRILQAMGAHRVVPVSDWLAARTDAGEPRHAMMVTGGIILASLLVRDLNAIAPLITMFFLITYAMINGAVAIEQSLDLVSFRPHLRVHRAIPLLGLAGSLLAMFIINATVSLVAVAVTLFFYGVLLRRQLDAPFEDVRSGLFVALAEWAAKKVSELPTMQERAWRPNLLIPVEDASDLRGEFLTIQDITHPQGSVKIFGLNRHDQHDALAREIDELTHAFREREVFASSTVIDTEGFSDGIVAGMQALRGAFFRPNIVFLKMPETPKREDEYRAIIREADAEQVGTLIYAPHPKAAFGQRQRINVWIRDRSPDWSISMDIGNLDLSILTAYTIAKNWDAELRLITVVDDPEGQPTAQDFLEKLIDLGRLPNATAIAETGTFDAYLDRAPRADLNIFGLLPDIDFAFPRRMIHETRSTCMFVRDSGLENALA